MKKKWNSLAVLFAIALCLLIGSSNAFAVEQPLSDLYYLADASANHSTKVSLQTVEGEQYLFLHPLQIFNRYTYSIFLQKMQ